MCPEHLPRVRQLLLACHQRRLDPAKRGPQGLCGLTLLHVQYAVRRSSMQGHQWHGQNFVCTTGPVVCIRSTAVQAEACLLGLVSFLRRLLLCVLSGSRPVLDALLCVSRSRQAPLGLALRGQGGRLTGQSCLQLLACLRNLPASCI